MENWVTPFIWKDQISKISTLRERDPFNFPLCSQEEMGIFCQGFKSYALIVLNITKKQKNRVLSRNNSDENWLIPGLG